MDFATCATQEFAVSSGSLLDTKELVKQAIDIVDLVGGVIQLRRQGRNYVGLCPWHDDTRPSLQVNPERQSFKCWVCDIGGDVFSFIMKMEGVTFPEALAMLADRAGIPLRPARSQPGAAPAGGQDKRTLYQAMAWAEKQYHECLLSAPEAEPARRYLHERGVTPQSIEKFHLGFSPMERDWILRRVAGDTNRVKILETIGVLARPAGGGFYDRFKGRVLFSIRDAQGRPVGIGGRVLPELGSPREGKGDSPHLCEAPDGPFRQMGTVPFSRPSHAKYVNSPETTLFTKNSLLYGLDVARDAIRKNRTALVMEGYTDCILAHQYGFDHAVAVLGTALGENHIRILKRFADRIMLILDGDEAGQRRSKEVLELFVAQKVDLRILTLPEGLDPCDYLHKYGGAAFADLLANSAVDALDFAYQVETRGIDLVRDVHGSSQALERMVSIVAKAPRLRADSTAGDRLREEKILERLASRFRVDEREVRRQVTALRRSQRGRAAAPRPEQASGAEPSVKAAAQIDSWQRELMELIVGYPQCWPPLRAQIDAAWLAAGPCRKIFETCCRLFDAGVEPAFDRLMLELDEPALKSLLVELDEGAQAKGSRGSDPEALLQDLIRTFQQQEAEKRRPADIVALREGGLDHSQENELLEEIVAEERSRQPPGGISTQPPLEETIRKKRNRQGISEPTDG